MNREEQLNEMLATINHYCNENPEASMSGIAIQIAVALADEEDRPQTIQALLLGIKHMSGE